MSTTPNLIAALWIGLALVANLLSIRLGISVALIEIGLGVLGGNVLGLQSTPWIDFLAALGAILLTFVADTEINLDSLRRHLRPSLLTRRRITGPAQPQRLMARPQGSSRSGRVRHRGRPTHLGRTDG